VNTPDTLSISGFMDDVMASVHALGSARVVYSKAART